MKQIIILMSIFSILFSATAQQNESIILLTTNEFKSQIEGDKVQLIDVRTLLEYNSGHIIGSKNIDFYSENFKIEFDKLDKSQPVYVYCRSGVRSNQAANKLAEMGFTEIFDLEGGFLNYK